MVPDRQRVSLSQFRLAAKSHLPCETFSAKSKANPIWQTKNDKTIFLTALIFCPDGINKASCF